MQFGVFSHSYIKIAKPNALFKKLCGLITYLLKLLIIKKFNKKVLNYY